MKREPGNLLKSLSVPSSSSSLHLPSRASPEQTQCLLVAAFISPLSSSLSVPAPPAPPPISLSDSSVVRIVNPAPAATERCPAFASWTRRGKKKIWFDSSVCQRVRSDCEELWPPQLQMRLWNMCNESSYEKEISENSCYVVTTTTDADV